MEIEVEEFLFDWWYFTHDGDIVSCIEDKEWGKSGLKSSELLKE